MNPGAFRWARSSCVRIRRTPGMARAAPVSRLTTRPLPIVAMASAAWTMPGRASSAANRAAPRTLSGACARGALGEGGALMGGGPLLGDHQGVAHRPGAELDPEAVVPAWLGSLQRRVAGGAGGLWRQRPTDQGSFGLAGAPGAGGTDGAWDAW